MEKRRYEWQSIVQERKKETGFLVVYSVAVGLMIRDDVERRNREEDAEVSDMVRFRLYLEALNATLCV